MVRRKGEPRSQEMRKKDVDAILAAARAFVDAVGHANLQVHFKSQARLDNGPIVDSIKIYCRLISGQELMDVQHHSTGGMMAVSFPESTKTPLHDGTVRLQHKPHMKPWPFFRIILPEAGAILFRYRDTPGGFLGEAQFRNEQEARALAVLVARAIRDELELG